MSKLTFAVMGMGNRGSKYAMMQLRYPDDMEVTAIADPRPVRTDAYNKYLNLPADRIFRSGEEMLEAPKLADIMVIATQDAQHKDHAVKAMEKGYDLLLEKPMANTLEDCRAIQEAAHKYGRRVIICHVLRYTIMYQYIRKLIMDGVLGKVEHIDMEERVGFYHYAHSYVRGNWHRMETSSPMILAKCCHDMDLMVWLTGRSAVTVSSFGSLDYFKAENCPEGAKERCTDGCKVDCPYNAPNFYFSRMPGWPTNILHPEPTKENIWKILETTDYGRCVFKMDNDVVDHQTTNVLMDDGSVINLCMNPFTERQTRWIHVMGTKGELEGFMKDRKLTLSIFGKQPQEIDLNPLYTDTTGHGGGDARMIEDIIRLYRGDDFDSSSITVIDKSTESHYMAFAAEYSRLHGGEPVNVQEFAKNYNA